MRSPGPRGRPRTPGGGTARGGGACRRVYPVPAVVSKQLPSVGRFVLISLCCVLLVFPFTLMEKLSFLKKTSSLTLVTGDWGSAWILYSLNSMLAP